MQAVVSAAFVADEGKATITVVDTDRAGSGAQDLTIAERHPGVTATLHTDASFRHAALSGTFSDTAAEPHTVVIAWGDGTRTLYSLGVSNGGTWHLTHRYKKARKHWPIEVVVVDGEGTLSNVLLLKGGSSRQKSGRRHK
jgi:hypothetical protein